MLAYSVPGSGCWACAVSAHGGVSPASGPGAGVTATFSFSFLRGLRIARAWRSMAFSTARCRIRARHSPNAWARRPYHAIGPANHSPSFESVNVETR